MRGVLAWQFYLGRPGLQLYHRYVIPGPQVAARKEQLRGDPFNASLSTQSVTCSMELFLGGRGWGPGGSANWDPFNLLMVTMKDLSKKSMIQCYTSFLAKQSYFSHLSCSELSVVLESKLIVVTQTMYRIWWQGTFDFRIKGSCPCVYI